MGTEAPYGVWAAGFCCCVLHGSNSSEPPAFSEVPICSLDPLDTIYNTDQNAININKSNHKPTQPTHPGFLVLSSAVKETPHQNLNSTSIRRFWTKILHPNVEFLFNIYIIYRPSVPGLTRLLTLTESFCGDWKDVHLKKQRNRRHCYCTRVAVTFTTLNHTEKCSGFRFRYGPPLN